MAFTISVIDNNLLRRISRKDNYHLYTKFYETMSEANYFNRNTELIITPAGIIEYLGLKIPKLEVSTHSIYQSSLNLNSESVFNFSKFNELRGKLTSLYEVELRQINEYSKSRFSKLMGKQKPYTEPLLTEWLTWLAKTGPDYVIYSGH